MQLATSSEQAAALERKYTNARAKIKRRGQQELGRKLEQVASSSCVVVNTNLGMTLDIVTDENRLYAPYHKLVQAGVRAPAALENARRRGSVEQLFYGDASREIVYGALSVTGRGLSSYGGDGGGTHLRLHETTVAYRSTVLQENSFFFAEQHKMKPGGRFPKGYLATWANRGKLAFAKLAKKLRKGMSDNQISELLVSSDGNRKRDSFLEVHIYGTFNRAALAHVILPEAKQDPKPRSIEDVNGATIEFLQSILSKLSIPWTH